MDLVVVNNQIVLMRKAVRQAKVHIVRKLTRNIDRLKKKKGSEEQLNRNKRRSQNQLDEINAIKALDCDDVSRFALMNTKKFAEVITKAKPSDKSRVMTRLAEHSSIRQLVDDFRQKFPNWENLLPHLLKMRLVRSKLKITATNEPNKKERKQKSKVKKSEAGQVDGENKIERSNLTEPELELDDGMHSEKEVSMINLAKHNAPNAPNEKEIRMISLDDDYEFSEDVEKDNGNDEENDDDVASERLHLDGDAKAVAKDEFIAFINEGNEAEADTDDDDDNQVKQTVKKPNKTWPQKPRKPPPLRKPKHTPTPTPTHTHTQRIHKRANPAPTNEGSLHPSWEAKKRLNQHNARFQGTKIKFDD